MAPSAHQNGEPYLGLLTFLSFTFSIIAAVLAIDMYTLLRTGEFGKTWRVIIIASVMYALLQALRLAETFNWYVALHGLSQIAELMFALSLTYAFYLQRNAFTLAARLRGPDERRIEARATQRADDDHTPHPEAAPSSADSAPGAARRDEDEAAISLHAEDESEIEWESQKPAA